VAHRRHSIPLRYTFGAQSFSCNTTGPSILEPGPSARMIVEVTSGAGRVTAYGSVIDNRTQDPTYVPAQ
jgi:hypothetical protein